MFLIFIFIYFSRKKESFRIEICVICLTVVNKQKILAISAQFVILTLHIVKVLFEQKGLYDIQILLLVQSSRTQQQGHILKLPLDISKLNKIMHSCKKKMYFNVEVYIAPFKALSPVGQICLLWVFSSNFFFVFKRRRLLSLYKHNYSILFIYFRQVG